jgi:hypothetical protein
MVTRWILLALAIGCAAPAPRAALPPLPDSISTQLGWIRVERVPYPTVDSTTTLGCFAHRTRRLQVATELSLAQAHEVLEHERFHVSSWDAHLALPDEVEEQVADIVAAARVAEMLARPR